MTHIDIATLPITSVLVIVAHPDDIESWCAGTVCRFSDVGKQVAYVLCTSGDKGTSDLTQTPQQVATTREVEPTLAVRRELVRQIRRHRPDLVITHDPVPPYRLHPDHRAVGRTTLDAIFPCARDPLTFVEQIREEGLQAHTVAQAWLFATEVPDIWIDIATTLPRKIAARLAHVSQYTDAQELQRNWQQRACDVGAAVGLEAAEAFKIIDFL